MQSKSNTKSEIAILTKGSPQIGLGHLVRCTALAQMLKGDFEITFYCREIPDEMLKEIKSIGFKCFSLRHNKDFIERLSDNSIAVLDGYNFDTDFQIKVKSTGSKLVCTDDLHRMEFVADLIIYHAPGIIPQEYKAQAFTQYALGLEYSLLRPVFLEQARKPRLFNEIRNVLICFGGSDPGNYTKEVLQSVIHYSQFRKIIVIIGPAFQDRENISGLIYSDSRIDLRENLNEQKMLEALREAELAIVPSSGILLEVLSTRCRVISGIVEDNQKLFYVNMRNEGLFIDAGNFSNATLNKAISEALTSGKDNRNVIDGFAGLRILKLFKNLRNESFIFLRNTKADDLEITYKWAVNPVIRRYSFQQHSITKSEHIRWFLKKINDKNCYYFIAEINKKSIGSIRFDLKKQNVILSYMLDPEYIGRGYGQIILKKGLEMLIHETNSDLVLINVIYGYVMKDNIASIRSLKRAGFLCIEKDKNYTFKKCL